MILVTGAAGKTGKAVIRALSERGVKARAWVHRPEQEEEVLAKGANEVIHGDMLDGETIRNALDGINVIYLICPNVHPYEFRIGQAIISEAMKAGLKRIVYHSVMYPRIKEMPHHWEKFRVEKELIKSGISFSIIQPASYMQNIIPYWSSIQNQGEYKVPYSVDSLFSPVDLENAAYVAAKLLIQDEYTNRVYQLAGPEQLTSKQMAELACNYLGRRVVAIQQDIGEWRVEAKQRPLSPYATDALEKMFVYYDKHGFFGSSHHHEFNLEKKPRTFAQFLAQLPR
jgi:uncharacterized protein YbjT (DUF2867 family)